MVAPDTPLLIAEKNPLPWLWKLCFDIQVQHTLDLLVDYSLKEMTDFYLASSVITLVNLSIGNETLKTSEKVKTLVDMN